MQAELKKQAEQAAALQQQLGHLAQSNQVVLTEKQRLAGQLQVAEAEKRMATEQVGRMQEEVKVERAEKAKLAEGVKALATRSGQLAQEIQQNRPAGPEHHLQRLRHQPRPGHLLGLPVRLSGHASRTSARKPKPCWSPTGRIRSPSVTCRTPR